MALDVERIQAVIWDLDNTLYRFTDDFYVSCTQAAAKAAKDLGIDLSYEDTLKLAEISEQEHGYSMHGYVTDHGLSYASLHFPFHQGIDERVIDPIEGLCNKLEHLNIPQIILTNASRCWADRVLKFIGIRHIFERDYIIPMEDVNFEPKARSDKGFKMALDVLGMRAENVLMVDDLDKNLMIPHSLGLQTAYIHHGDKMQNMPNFIDDQFTDVLSVIDIINP